MNIAIISASTRANSESRNVSDYLQAELQKVGATPEIIDLYDLKLPIYDTVVEGDLEVKIQAVRQKLATCDGCIFVSPEWGGMMSAGLVNFFHYLDQELADKPIYLVGVSSGRGGRYPLIQMRQMGYKNRHFVIIPESLFIDSVRENLVNGDMHNEHIVERVRYGLRTLIAYAKALRNVRESGVINYDDFKNGW